jgi:hypothetical protein
MDSDSGYHWILPCQPRDLAALFIVALSFLVILIGAAELNAPYIYTLF